MGTSTSFKGGQNGNPLIPSWLNTSSNGDNAQSLPSEDTPKQDESNPDKEQNQNPSSEQIEHLENNKFQIFSNARREMTHFIGSSGREKSRLKKAVSSYVKKTLGGVKTGTRRMSTESKSVGNFANILYSAQNIGIRQYVKSVNLASVADKPIADIYVFLIDEVCPVGVTLDDALVRKSYLDALEYILKDTKPEDLEYPTPEITNILIKEFISNTIKNRIITAIAAKAVSISKNLAEVNQVFNSIMGYVKGVVSDILSDNNGVFESNQLHTQIDNIYDQVLTVLSDIDEGE